MTSNYRGYLIALVADASLCPTVRRQSFWDSGLVHLREALARLLGDVKRPADDAASVDW